MNITTTEGQKPEDVELTDRLDISFAEAIADVEAPLYEHCPGEFEEQDAYIQLDEDGNVSASYSRTTNASIGQFCRAATADMTWSGTKTTMSVFSMMMRNGHDAAAIVPVIYQPTWGDRTSSYKTINSWVGTGTTALDATISLTNCN